MGAGSSGIKSLPQEKRLPSAIRPPSTAWDPAVIPQRALPASASPLVPWPSLGGHPPAPSQPWSPPRATQRQQDAGGGGSRQLPVTSAARTGLPRGIRVSPSLKPLMSPSGLRSPLDPVMLLSLTGRRGLDPLGHVSFRPSRFQGGFQTQQVKDQICYPASFCHYLQCAFLTGLC